MISSSGNFIMCDALLHVKIYGYPFFIPTQIQYFQNYHLGKDKYFYGFGDLGEEISPVGIPLGNIELILS